MFNRKICTFAVLNLKVKEKKYFTLEIVEQTEKVTIYSILFDDDEENEFMKFIQKYSGISSFIHDVQRILYYVEKLRKMEFWKGILDLKVSLLKK